MTLPESFTEHVLWYLELELKNKGSRNKTRRKEGVRKEREKSLA